MYASDDINDETFPSQPSSYDEDEEQEAQINDVLEEERGYNIYMENTNFSKTQSLRL